MACSCSIKSTDLDRRGSSRRNLFRPAAKGHPSWCQLQRPQSESTDLHRGSIVQRPIVFSFLEQVHQTRVAEALRQTESNPSCRARGVEHADRDAVLSVALLESAEDYGPIDG